MKKTILIASFILISFAGRAQQTISTQNLADFKSVDLAGKLRVEMIHADAVKMEAKVSNTDVGKLEWSVKNGVLTMRLKPGSSPDASAEVKIYFNELESIKLSASNVNVKDTVRGVMLDADLSAGATLGMTVDVKDLKVNAGGNSVADITGSAKYYNVSAGTKSKVNSRSMEAVDANVNATTTAEVYVAASERLIVMSDSGASVFYRGEPEILRTVTRLMGSINNIGK